MLLNTVRKLFGYQRWCTIDEVRQSIEGGDLQKARQLTQRLHPATPDRDLIAQTLLAEIDFRQDQNESAEAGFRQVLSVAPGFAEAHYGLSLLMAEQQKYEAALEHAVFAKNLKPQEARFEAQLGYCYILMGAYPPAEPVLRQAVKLNPRDKRAWNNLGLVLRTKGDIAEAKACFLTALNIDSGYQTAIDNMALLDSELDFAGMQVTVEANAIASSKHSEITVRLIDSIPEWAQVEDLLAHGAIDAALNLAEELQSTHLDSTELTLCLEKIYRRTGDIESALHTLERHIEHNPDAVDAHVALGNLQLQLGKHALAVAAYQNALALGATGADIHANLGLALHALERYAEALEALRAACAQEASPAYRKLLAGTLIMACQYDEAIETYEQLISEGQLKQEELLGNYSSALAYAGRFDEALNNLDRVLNFQAHDPGLRMMRAIIHLLNGRYAEGWDDYFWRNMGYSRNFRTLPFEKWRGEELEGKRIVVLAEQGLGDQVMFASCLPDLFQLKPARLVVEVIDRVAPTLARSFPFCEVIATRQKKDLQWVSELGPMDYFVPLGDLPKYFRRSVDAFPGTPYLKADPEKQQKWRQRLAACGPRPWLGFSWRGGTEITRTGLRSLEVAQMEPVLSAAPATWVNLQYGPVAEDLKVLNDIGHVVHHWPEAIADLDEFAALISVLDGVITVCNTTVHYAGALGIPVWIMAPHIPEWRYGLTNPSLPWYASSTVLRQAQAGQWHGVLQQAAKTVSGLALRQSRI